MGYSSARDVFPENILRMIQEYVDGECIYIPKKEENKIAWGKLTKSKEELLVRNNKIYEDHLSGISIQSLSETYYLSPKTIQRIILQKKNI
ncbi:CD3324 family protein [uncultured Clostridium sp.]|uniref:CD3324 family protein n=1 Tax=uncultured Clostridium sp. TaxID=59620 RepID=UPI0028E7382E|nr:CD3324 family protein [uncultured Clostridium sp.]